MNAKPSVFIGSSSEALPIARFVAKELSATCDVKLWDDRLFELGEDTLKGLLRAVLAYDYAVLVISADDTLISRRQSLAAPRDNVIFELGLFMGAMGRRRAFAVIAPGSRGAPKIPSDLLGNNVLFLKEETVAAPTDKAFSNDLEPLVETIVRRFAEESEFELLPSTGSAVSYFHNFVLPVCLELSSRKFFEIAGTQYEIGDDKYQFNIIMPGSLTEANRPFAAKLFGKLPVQAITVKTTHREFPFWVSTTVESGKIIFWDYPTILKASDEAVEFVTRGAFLSKPSIRRRFETKELHNFERSIELLLATSDASTIKNNVKIIPSGSL